MRIFHLNCATMRPYAFVLSGTGGLMSRSSLVAHCLLIETNEALVLVDTGFGTGDYVRPTRLVRWFTALSGCPRDLNETAAQQVTGLGYRLEDVRHIVLTHLHLDHAGGLPDFPHARVHLLAEEFKAAMDPRSTLERWTIPAHWSHWPKWVLHEAHDDPWVDPRFGLNCVDIVPGLSPEILLIPLTGHTRGHCGVAVRTPDGWLFHCGDAYLYHGDVHPDQSESAVPSWIRPLSRRLFPHAPRLRALARKQRDEVRLFCAHDAAEFAALREDASYD